MLYYGFNFGVEYRYAVPLYDAKKDKDEKQHRLLQEASYGWVHGGWGECNVHCGGGKYEKGLDTRDAFDRQFAEKCEENAGQEIGVLATQPRTGSYDFTNSIALSH